MSRRFVSFLWDCGIGEANAVLSDYDVIESFVVKGLPGRRSSTKGTYRSVLTRLAETTPGEGRPTPFSGSVGSVPYGRRERAELVAMASAQRTPAKRFSAQVMVGAGIGCGCSPAELVALRTSDVRRIDGRVEVRISGGRPRLVMACPPWDSLVLSLARGGGTGFLFRPGHADRDYKNFVNDFARHLHRDPEAPSLSMGRCRASFLCDRLASGVPLSEVLAASGLVEVESLARYARFVPGLTASKAALRARLAAERDR